MHVRWNILKFTDMSTKPDFLPPNIYSNIHCNNQYQVYYLTFSLNVATPK